MIVNVVTVLLYWFCIGFAYNCCRVSILYIPGIIKEENKEELKE